MEAVLPVFLRKRDVVRSEEDVVTGLELCVAAERTAGRGSITGAQDIRGLWRIYPTTQAARNELLIKGMNVRNCTLQVSHTNPFILRDDSGTEEPSTKLWVSDIPISVANSEIEHSIVKTGCELRSAIKLECYRDKDNKLTRFQTGRRFVFITVPKTPLEKTLAVAGFQAKIYHREQKTVRKDIVCSKCLQTNHHVSVCENDVVCLACKLAGHKRGDSVCAFSGNNTVQNMTGQDRDKQTNAQTNALTVVEAQSSIDTSAATHDSALHVPSVSKTDKDEHGTDKTKGKGGGGKQALSRGRKEQKTPVDRRQLTLSMSMQRVEHGRHRSTTPKRRLSGEKDRSPVDKFPRRDKTDSDNGEEQGEGEGWVEGEGEVPDERERWG